MPRHHVVELDLSKMGHTNTISDRMNTVPGFKTSAGKASSPSSSFSVVLEP